ncbi:putative glycoside hydrolase [Patescibacteria group bacterium]|nr:putative glycoside hydrolase [Patescibacteria group bacterium]
MAIVFFYGGVFAKENRIFSLINYYLEKINAIETELKANASQKILEEKEVQPPTNDTTKPQGDTEGAISQSHPEDDSTTNASQEAEGPKEEESPENLEPKKENDVIVSRMKTPKNVKSIYITVGTIASDYGWELIDKLIESGGNAVVIDIEHGGGLLAFTPKNEYLTSINPGSTLLDHFPEIIDKLHKKGLYVIARQVVFNDPYVGSRKPEWRIQNKWGGLYDYRWLDPSKPGVQNYNLYIMQEVANLGFDEVQFDYIRFPAAAHQTLDYYYDEEKFSRTDVINDFLSKARRLADDHDIQLSVDVFGAIVWGNVDWKIVGQDPVEIAKYVDAIYPMTYPSHVSPGYYGYTNPWGAPYGFVHDSIKNFVEKADGNAEIRTWVQGFPLRINGFGTWFMNDQIKATYDAGGAGFAIWSPGNRYSYSWPSFGIEVTPPEQEVSEEGAGE